MRIDLTFRRGTPIEIPADYRRRFISLLKSAFYDEFPDLYEKRAVKPYTFAAIFNRGVRFERGRILNVRTVVFKFSTGREDLFATLVNFAIRMKRRGEGISFGKDAPTFKLTDVRLRTTPPITGRFATLSPVVVNDPSADPRDPKRHYLLPEDEDYEARLHSILKDRMEAIVGRPPKGFRLKEHYVREVMVRHYGGYVRGAVGSMGVEGDGETLRFIYDYGLGVRTGQGFGMLKVLEK